MISSKSPLILSFSPRGYGIQTSWKGEAFQDDIRPRLVRWQSIGRLAAASSPRRRGPSKGKPNLLAQHPLLPCRLLDSRFRGNDALESVRHPCRLPNHFFERRSPLGRRDAVDPSRQDQFGRPWQARQGELAGRETE